MSDIDIAHVYDVVYYHRQRSDAPLAWTKAELDAMFRFARSTHTRWQEGLPLTVLGHPAVEIPSWPMWIENAARIALGDLDPTPVRHGDGVQVKITVDPAPATQALAALKREIQSH